MNNVKTKRYIQHYIKNFNPKNSSLSVKYNKNKKKKFLLIAVYSKQKSLPKKK